METPEGNTLKAGANIFSSPADQQKIDRLDFIEWLFEYGEMNHTTYAKAWKDFEQFKVNQQRNVKKIRI